MRLKYGPAVTVAQQSVSSRLLMDMGVSNPDFLPTIMSTFVEDAPFMALLDAKGLKTKGLNLDTSYLKDGGKYRTVSNNHVQYRIKFTDMRKEHFRTNVTGVTYADYANPTQPGLNNQPFYIFLDSNWIGGQDVILLADQKTQLWCDNARGGEAQPGGVWRYKVKIVGTNPTEYVDPSIMQDGYECQLAMTLHQQDFSTFGNERYTGNGVGDAYLSLQRLKYSWSGTAAAIDKNRKVSGNWMIGADNSLANATFLSYADQEMMRWAARFLDFQLLQGKRTVNQDTKKVVLTDENNQEILAGDGVLYSGDGPIEYPQSNGWTPQFIENFWRDISEYIKPDEEGNSEFAILMPPQSFISFNQAMYTMGVTKDANIMGEGDDKIINNTYRGYDLAGIRGIAVRYNRLGFEPGVMLNDGTKTSDWRCIVVPLGKTNSGERGIEMLQLRPMVEGTVAGLDQGGNIASSVDGSSKHILMQNGVVCQNQIFTIYKPYVGKTL